MKEERRCLPMVSPSPTKRPMPPQATSVNTATATTWYAFLDPNTGREYFHEPETGETTWVLPTTSSNATTTREERVGMRMASPTTKGGTAAVTNEKDTKRQRWSTVAIAIATILVFNTLFLVGLVKFLYETGPSQQIQAHEQSMKLKLQNDDVEVAVEANPAYNNVEDEPFAQEDANETDEENDSTTEECANSTSDVPSDVTQSSSPEEHGVLPKKKCWIPFSYILVKECRRKARGGLPMPLADIDNSVWI